TRWSASRTISLKLQRKKISPSRRQCGRGLRSGSGRRRPARTRSATCRRASFPTSRWSTRRFPAEPPTWFLRSRRKSCARCATRRSSSRSRRFATASINSPSASRSSSARGSRKFSSNCPAFRIPKRRRSIQQTALLEFKLVDDTHSVQDALKSGPPPGTQILYGQDRAPYLLQAQPLMTGAYIADAHVRPSSRLEGPYVELVLNNTGARLFERITAENVKRRLAIVLDNKVYSAPVIQERISGGRASITGRFEMKDARELAIVLRAGALPAPLEVAEERTVGPSLGSDSIRQGVISFIVGSSLVIIFMLVYYKGAGMLANIALIFHILFLLAILAAFRAVLTLPGIA